MNEHNILKILYFLSTVNEATAQDIQMKCYLSQPETSQVCQELEKLGYIRSRRENLAQGKGRPYNIYKLKYTIQEIKEFYKIKLEEEYKNKVMEMNKILKGDFK